MNPPPRHECQWWPAVFGSTTTPPREDDDAWGKGEWQPRSPLPVDPFAQYYDKLAGYFVEAARRLPLAQIPYLARCITDKALAIGFADPVTNILLATIHAFAHTEPYMIHPVDTERTRHKITFDNAARCSWVAMNRFMACYFRYLTGPQADLLLHTAGYDLRVAIEAVELHIGGPPKLLVPDSARIITAFEDTAYPRSSAPYVVRQMTSSYRRCMVEPILEDLRRGGQLTADCVHRLCTLLRSPWSPPPRPPPPTPGTFRDSSGGFTMIYCFGDGSFVTTRISKDGLATATTSHPTDAGCPVEDTTSLLSMFPIHDGRQVIHEDFCSLTLQTPEFLPFLRGQLLDVIHGVYLKAISMLPVRALREGHLLHSLLIAGHCYGPLDPVSNIVINTIWYDAFFPLSRDIASQIGTADILDARCMHRVESRSIDGLVAYLCRNPSTDEQDAVTLLCKNRLHTPILDLSNMCDVALAAKHPQPAAFGQFLERASIQGLYNTYCLSRIHGDPDSSLEGLKMALLQETSQTARVAAPMRRYAHHMDRSAALEKERSSFMSQQAHVRRVLEYLLIGYGYNDPLVCTYICLAHIITNLCISNMN
jgi:hypothetical protein